VSNTDPTYLYGLYFTKDGMGPTPFRFRITRHDPKRPELGDKLYFGLRREMNDLMDANAYYDAGGYMLSPEDARELHRQLGEELGELLAEDQGR
jgi:hypothetical protein